MCATGIRLSNIVLIYGVIMNFITLLKRSFLFPAQLSVLFLQWKCDVIPCKQETLFRGALLFNEAGNKLQTYVHTYVHSRLRA